MNKLELGYLIHEALRHALKEQEKLLKHDRVADLLPIIRQLAQFTLELEEWYSDKFHLKDRCDHFLAEAEKIEAEADRISERIWRYAPVGLTPIFREIRDRRAQLAGDRTYTKQLRAQYNNFRLGLLEQVAGARLLENNNDLGEECERILVQYLERRLGSGVRVLRGGHIYDYEDNRSGQIDIIVTSADSLGFCPADTGGGKYNVMIDQVIAAISVTSRLTTDGFCQRWQGLQKIPVFKQKEQSYPNLKDHAWPLCYICGAESDDLEALLEAWKRVASAEDRHIPQMVLLLDSGYIMAGTACWPRFRFRSGAAAPPHVGIGLNAGLGLGWLEAQIAGRNAVLTRRSPDWVQNLSDQLSQLELKEVRLLPLAYDPRQHRFSKITTAPIKGVLEWGWEGEPIHNRLELISIRVAKTTLTNPMRPISSKEFFGRYDFEPRWFRTGVVVTKGHYCALEEWLDATDSEQHRWRVIVFDSRTGDEVTSKLSRSIANCAELEQLNPVVREDICGDPAKT